MESILVIVVIVLLFMVISLWGKTNRLIADSKRLQQTAGEQGAELNRVLEWMQGRHDEPTAVPVRRRAALRPESVTLESSSVAAVPPQPALQPVGELLRDVVHEEIPGVAVASAVIGVAQRPRQKPSILATWIAGLRATDEWEALIGGRLLNRIGAVALILGMAFFFKYAVDQNWISQGLRVACGVLVGATLLALAYRSHQRGYAIFGQGLVGAGQAVLYLSVYASYNFYHLVPQPVALLAMGAVTALGFVQALYFDSLAVSLLACAGGYLTPFLLDAGSSSPTGTIVYVLLLDIGVLAVLLRKTSWIVLEPIALTATYVTYFGWYFASYHSDRVALAAIALTVFWALFLAFDLYGLLTPGDLSENLRHFLGVVNNVAYYAGLFALLGPDHRGWMSVCTLAIASFQVGALLTLRRQGRLSVVTAARYSLTAMVLLVAATAIAFRDFTVVILWSLEALPLVWYGIRWKLWYIWRPALVVYALATGLLFATVRALAYSPIGDFRPLVNPRALAFLVLSGALAASTIPFRRLQREHGPEIELSLHYGWIGLLFILLTVEITDVFRRFGLAVSAESVTNLHFERSLTIAAVWMAFSLVLVWFGLKKRVFPWLSSALGLAGLSSGLVAVVGILFEPVQRYTPIVNLRVLTFALIIAGLATQLRWLTRDRQLYPWIDPVRSVLQVVILLLGFELVTAEINDYFLRRVGQTFTSTDTGSGFVELALLAAIWMFYSLLPTWYGVRKRTMPLIALGLTMAAAATGVTAFAGLVFQPTSELGLLLGVRPIVLTVVIAGLLLQLRWLRDSAAGLTWSANVLLGLQAAIILLGFGLISAETRDAFAQRINGTGADGAAGLRDLERLAFSLIWLAYAILVMGIGIWRRARWMRLGAMALFACVIVKVFTYDLSFLGAVYRPISFGGLGIILLLVSFLYQRYRTILLN